MNTQFQGRKPARLARAGVLLLALGLVVGLIGWLRQADGPRFRGRTVVGWLYNTDPDFTWIPNDVYGHVHDELWDQIVARDSESSSNSPPVQATGARPTEVEDAIRHLGEKAIPQLLQLMSSSNLTSREKLHRQISAWLPTRLGRWLSSETGYVWGDAVSRRHIAAFNGFTILGTNAEPALPALSNLLFSTNADLPLAWSIGNIGPRGIDLLTAALRSTNAPVRDVSALALGLQEGRAKTAVPALVDCVDRGHASYHVLGALGRIGCDDPRLVSALLRLMEAEKAAPTEEFDDTMAFLVLGLRGTNAHAAGPQALAGYRACDEPGLAVGRRFYRRILKTIAPDLSGQLPAPRSPDEESPSWP